MEAREEKEDQREAKTKSKILLILLSINLDMKLSPLVNEVKVDPKEVKTKLNFMLRFYLVLNLRRGKKEDL